MRKGILFEIAGVDAAFASHPGAPATYGQAVVHNAVAAIPDSITMSVDPLSGRYETGGSGVLLTKHGDILTGRKSSPKTRLTSALTASATTIHVGSTADLPSSGYVWIEAEAIYYSGKTALSLTGCVRGSLGTTAASHDILMGGGVTKWRYVLGYNPFVKGRPCQITKYDLDDATSTTLVYTGYVDSIKLTTHGWVVGIVSASKKCSDAEVLYAEWAKGKFRYAQVFVDKVQAVKDLGEKDTPNALVLGLADEDKPLYAESSGKPYRHIELNSEVIRYENVEAYSSSMTSVGISGGEYYFENDDPFDVGDSVRYTDSSGNTIDAKIVKQTVLSSGSGAKYRHYVSAVSTPVAGTSVTAPLKARVTGIHRAKAGTRPGSHKQGDDWREVRVIEGNHIRVLLALLLSGGTDATYGSALYDSWGLGLGSVNVDIAAFERLFARCTHRAFVFRETAKMDTLLALFARTTGGRVFWSEEGKLTVLAEGDAYPDSLGSTISTSTVVSIPSWDDGLERTFNTWNIRGYSQVEGKFKDTYIIQDRESQEKFGVRSYPDLEDPSLLYSQDAGHIELLGYSVIGRYADGAVELQARAVHVDGVVYRPGSLVAVTMPHMPNKDGTSGYTSKIFEVLSCVPRDDKHTDTLILLEMPALRFTRLVTPSWEVESVDAPNNKVVVRPTSYTFFADSAYGGGWSEILGAGRDGKEDIDFALVGYACVFWDVSTMAATPPVTQQATITAVDYILREITFSSLPGWLSSGDIIRLDTYDNVLASATTIPVNAYMALADETTTPPSLGTSQDEAFVWGG